MGSHQLEGFTKVGVASEICLRTHLSQFLDPPLAWVCIMYPTVLVLVTISGKNGKSFNASHECSVSDSDQWDESQEPMIVIAEHESTLPSG